MIILVHITREEFNQEREEKMRNQIKPNQRKERVLVLQY